MRTAACQLLRCPECKDGGLQVSDPVVPVIKDGSLQCTMCPASFVIRNGIPVFLSDEILRASSAPAYSTLDSATRQKILQREWHDTAHIDGDGYKDARYTDQSLFAFVIYYQLREAETLLAGSRPLRIANVCCGHGFELEFISLLTKEVILIDISEKSLQKAVLRAEQLGLHVEALCCDAENLPLRPDTFDLVLTHHSLHHLASPMVGLEEMIRITKSRVAVFEPASGFARSAVRAFGLRARVEEAGNVVFEFNRREVEQLCQNTGARVRYFHKYLITGPTSEPGVFRWLDNRGITPVLCSGIRTANRLLGRFVGTKCSIFLEKEPQSTVQDETALRRYVQTQTNFRE